MPCVVHGVGLTQFLLPFGNEINIAWPRRIGVTTDLTLPICDRREQIRSSTRRRADQVLIAKDRDGLKWVVLTIIITQSLHKSNGKADEARGVVDRFFQCPVSVVANGIESLGKDDPESLAPRPCFSIQLNGI